MHTPQSGTFCTMRSYQENAERQARADRLRQARINSGLGGIKAVSKKFGWNQNNYKAHDSGQNGFGIVLARQYAKAFGVSLQWLYFGTGSPNDIDAEDGTATTTDLGRHYIKAWRTHAGLSIDDAAAKLGLELSALSMIENCLSPYSQQHLEAMARLYSCSIADLLQRSPSDKEAQMGIADMLKYLTHDELIYVRSAIDAVIRLRSA